MFHADDTTVSLLTSSQSQTVTFTIAASDNVGVSSVSLPGASLSSASGGSYVFTKHTTTMIILLELQEIP